MINKLTATCIAAAVGMSATAATAAPTFTFDSNAHSPSSAGFTVINSFTSLTGYTAISGNVQIKTPPADSDGAPPPTSVPSGTSYLSVLGGGSVTYTFAAPVGGVQFDWGSVDTYNTVTLLSAAGNFVIVPGTTPNILFPTTNGDQGFSGSGLFTALGNGVTFTGITFASSSNSLEVDNLATSAVPEPASWAMMLAGFGMLGMGLRRRGKQSVRVTYA